MTTYYLLSLPELKLRSVSPNIEVASMVTTTILFKLFKELPILIFLETTPGFCYGLSIGSSNTHPVLSS